MKGIQQIRKEVRNELKMKCGVCGKTKEQHTKEITQKNRKDIEVFYCYSVDDLKRKEVDWNTFLSKKFKLKKEVGK